MTIAHCLAMLHTKFDVFTQMQISIDHAQTYEVVIESRKDAVIKNQKIIDMCNLVVRNVGIARHD